MDLDDHFGSSVSMRPLLGHSSKFYRMDCNGTYSQGRGIQGNILKKNQYYLPIWIEYFISSEALKNLVHKLWYLALWFLWKINLYNDSHPFSVYILFGMFF